MLKYITEIISVILGAIAGGLAVGVFMHIKNNRISSKHQGNNVASSGGVATENVQGNIIITNNSQSIDSTPILSYEAQRILRELYSRTYIYLDKTNQEIYAYSETEKKDKISITDYADTLEAIEELTSLQYLERTFISQKIETYKLTSYGKNAVRKIIK